MRVTEYKLLGKLPDPFLFENGARVKNTDEWIRRRFEISKYAVDLQYGKMPPEPEFLDILPLYDACVPYALSGYRITTGPKSHPVSFIMYVHWPKSAGNILPAIIDGDQCWHKFYANDILKTVADHDYIYVSFDRTELACDIQSLGRKGPLYDAYPDGNFGAIAAWAWGYSRCVDALEQLGIADMEHIVFTGLSRGGKTALLAGAVDERAFLVNPEATCAGGGSCYRVHMKAITDDGDEGRSETLADIYKNFPFWFTPELGAYAGHEELLPFDSHELKAMVAPRILFVSEASSDIWASPLGSYQSTIAAKEVYRFLGKEENILWYWRTGYHNQTLEDYEMLLNVMDHEIKGVPLNEKFNKIPFQAPELPFDWRSPEPC